MYLIDTNILLRYAVRNHSSNPTVRSALQTLLSNGNQLHITAQNCVEFWNVATRPLAKNGFGLSLIQAERSLRRIERLFQLLPDRPEVCTEWRRLVVQFGVSGVQVHDARLVAAMRVNRMTHILTFNTADFRRYASEGIVIVDPASV